MITFKNISILTLIALITGCMSDANFKKKLVKTLKEDPSILHEVIKDDPLGFMKTVSKTNELAREQLQKDYSKRIEDEISKAIDKPLEMKITSEDVYAGDKDAPLKLFVYSDFQCPFCKKGHEVVENLKQKLGKKITYIYRHLPLSNHPHAMIAAQYFEAIALQDNKKAMKFHDILYTHQKKVNLGETYLKEVSKNLDVDMKRLKVDINSNRVLNKIEKDVQSAHKLGMQGTPGYILNGVPVKGAYPYEHFIEIIEKLKSKGKVALRSPSK